MSARRFPLIREEANPDKLTLVLEPEAAAVYCQNMTAIQRAAYCIAPRPFTSDNYLVVDIGGGTVDIVAYRINKTPEPHMEVIHEPTGGAWGGTKVNLEFKEFLENITADKDFSQYVGTPSETENAVHQADLDEIVYKTFESQKTILGDRNLTENGTIMVQLNYTFLQKYRDQLQDSIQRMQAKNESHTTYSGNGIRITYEKLRMFYDPVIKGIVESVEAVLKEVTEVRTIYLVGGFGGCRYIHDKLHTHFGDRYKYIVPEGRNYAVVKGAAMMRKNPDFLQSRRVDATYGVRAAIKFEKGKHEEMYHISNMCTNMCTNIFSTFVEKGDVVSSRDMYMMTYTPESRDQKEIRVQIYSSSEKDVWYTTGKRPSHARNSTTWADVQKIGELLIPFCNAGGDDSNLEDQQVDVMFDFSTAEIKVNGYHHKSQTKVRVVLDFLEA